MHLRSRVATKLLRCTVELTDCTNILAPKSCVRPRHCHSGLRSSGCCCCSWCKWLLRNHLPR
jgi:hypothetical protein